MCPLLVDICHLLGRKVDFCRRLRSDDQTVSHCSDLFPHMWDAVCSPRRSSDTLDFLS